MLGDDHTAYWKGYRCRDTWSSLVVDDDAVGIAPIGELVIITPVLAIVGEHTLLTVLVVPNLAQLTLLHNTVFSKSKIFAADTHTSEVWAGPG